MAKPSPSFFEAQTPPDLPAMSMDNIDWYNMHLERCFEGYEYRGTRMTGDQYWYHNFYPMLVSVLDKKGKPTKNFKTLYPYWSQEDDYLFKQIEEADQGDQGVFFFTGRGYGKTYLVESIGAKGFYLIDEFHGVISASGDDHASETWAKFRNSINSVNKAHPSLRKKLFKDNESEIKAGEEIYSGGDKETIVSAFMEKIVYDKKAGKTKGRRLNFQHFEEAGDWQGAASLKECIAASEGSWYVGSTKKCREFYTGTGGTVHSKEAKEIFYHPEAYNLYTVTEWNNRPTAICIPAYKKYGGTWESDGISNVKKAKEILDAKRLAKLKDPDPTAYTKFIQEYPYNPDEMFSISGANRFDQKKIAYNISKIESKDPQYVRGAWGNLHWVRKNGQISGVSFEQDASGKVWMLEEPERNPVGEIWDKLYVGGYDGIDVGSKDTSSGQGSQGAISIKKRMLTPKRSNNVYVCHYFERPHDIDDFFETCWKVMVYWNAITNIEDTKRGIVGYLKNKKDLEGQKSLRWLMKRPRLTLTNPEQEKLSNLLGTTATTKNFEYGENFLIQHIKEYGDQLHCLPALHDLRDFKMDNRGDHDITVSMFMTELADDEFMDAIIIKPKPNYSLEEEYGYYTDRKGKKVYGKLPKKADDPFNFKSNEDYVDYVDMSQNTVITKK